MSSFINLIIFALDREVIFVVLKYVLTSLLVNGVIHSEIYFTTYFVSFQLILSLSKILPISPLDPHSGWMDSLTTLHTVVYGISCSLDIFALDCFVVWKKLIIFAFCFFVSRVYFSLTIFVILSLSIESEFKLSDYAWTHHYFLLTSHIVFVDILLLYPLSGISD